MIYSCPQCLQWHPISVITYFYWFYFQNNLTAVEHVKLEASAAEEQNLLYEQSDLRIEVVELTRLAAIKVCALTWYRKLILF